MACDCIDKIEELATEQKGVEMKAQLTHFLSGPSKPPPLIVKSANGRKKLNIFGKHCTFCGVLYEPEKDA